MFLERLELGSKAGIEPYLQSKKPKFATFDLILWGKHENCNFEVEEGYTLSYEIRTKIGPWGSGRKKIGLLRKEEDLALWFLR